MKPETMVKSVWEKRRLEFDVTLALAAGDSVDEFPMSPEGVTVIRNSDSEDVTVDMVSGDPTIVGNKIYTNITGGDQDEVYTVLIRVVTVNGDYIEDSIQLSVIAEE